VIAPIENDVASRLNGFFWTESGPASESNETGFGTSNETRSCLMAAPAFCPCQLAVAALAVAAGFEPAEGCPSRAFEFCGWWFRPVRLGLVAPEPKLGSPLRTPLNLRE